MSNFFEINLKNKFCIILCLFLTNLLINFHINISILFVKLINSNGISNQKTVISMSWIAKIKKNIQYFIYESKIISLNNFLLFLFKKTSYYGLFNLLFITAVLILSIYF